MARLKRVVTPRGNIRVNRNVITFLGIWKLSTPALNTLISIIDALKQYIVIGETFQMAEMNDLQVNIPWNNISARHEPALTLKNIIPLMDMKVFYSYSFGGMDSMGVVHVIDQAEYSAGMYHIRIAAKALPWYVFCGKKVGFANIEKTVFFSIKSSRLKVLYLMIMANVDAREKCGIRTFTVEELRTILGLDSTPFFKIKQAVIKPLIGVFDQDFSYYRLSVTEEVRGGCVGRPSVDKIFFSVKSKTTGEEDYVRVHQLVSSCISALERYGRPLRTPIEIADALDRNGDLGAFLCKMSLAEGRAQKKACDGQTNLWLRANRAAKILREDFGEEVYKSEH